MHDTTTSCSATGQRIRDPWFLLPVLFCMFMDAGVSLAFQPSGYWNDPSLAHEGNPTWVVFLAIGPLAFLGAFLVYAAVIALLLLWLRGALQKLLGMCVLLAHSYGAATWCYVALPDRWYWWGLMALLILEAIVFSVYWYLSPACVKLRRSSTPGTKC